MNASWLVTLGIPGLAVLVVSLVVLAITLSAPTHARRRWARLSVCGALLWLGATATLAARGVLLDTSFPGPVLVMGPTVVGSALLGASKVGAALARRVPVWLLVLFHSFRLPLEWVMHQAFAEGVMPRQMSYSGYNFDILSGVLALLIGSLLYRGKTDGRRLILVFSVIGTTLLAAIGTIAIASLPHFRGFGEESAVVNRWVLHFPFVWLPAGLFASAVFGHSVLWCHVVRRKDLAQQLPRPQRASPS